MKTLNGMVVSYVVICQTEGWKYEYNTLGAATTVLERHESNNDNHDVYVIGRARDPLANNEIVEEWLEIGNGVVFE